MLLLLPLYTAMRYINRRFTYFQCALLYLCCSLHSKLTFSINRSHRSLNHLFGPISRIFMTISGLNGSSLFIALHGMQTPSSDENNLSVRLSVRLSNAWIVTKRKESLRIFIHYEKHLALFSDKKEWLAGDPIYLNFWDKATPLKWNRRFSVDIRSWCHIAATAVTTSEKSSINTNRKSTTHFPMSLRWTSYVCP